MPKIDKITHPNDPSSYVKPIYGFAPGIVLSVDDPEKLGRIQVACDLIAPNVPLPNDCDGWVPWVESFTNNSVPGGSFAPIMPGTQVVLLPMFGNAQQWVAIGCLHSRVDRPSPEFDRTKRIYGSHTLGQVFDIHDDENSRSIKTYPNGVSHKVSADGNYTIQTFEGARMQLRSDGSMQMENDAGYVSVSRSGVVESRNHEGGGTVIGKGGSVTLDSPGQQRVKLDKFGLSMDGQVDEVAAVREKIEKNTTGILSATRLFGAQMQGIISELPNSEDPYFLIAELDEILGYLEGSFSLLGSSKQDFQSLSEFEAADLGKAVLGQIDLFRKYQLDKVVTTFNGFRGEINGEQIVSQIKSLVGEEVAPEIKIDPQELETTLKGLQDNPDKQSEAIIDAILPTGIGSVASIVGLDLLDKIPGLKLVRSLADMELAEVLGQLKLWGDVSVEDLIGEVKQISETLDQLELPVSFGAILGFVGQIEGAIAQLQGYIDEVQEQFDRVDELVNQVGEKIADRAFETGVGGAIIELGTQLVEGIEGAQGQLVGITALRSLTSAIIKLTSIDDYDELGKIPEILETLNQFFQTRDFESKIVNPQASIQNVQSATKELTKEISQKALPDALTKLTGSLSLSLSDRIPVFNQFLDTLNSQTKGGGVRANREKIRFSADSGDLGGVIELGKDTATISGPGGERGFGSQFIASASDAIVQAPGSDASLGSKMFLDAKNLSLSTPGTKGGLGSSVELDPKKIKLFAPGSKRGAGSSVEVKQKKIRLNAPGGENGGGSFVDIALDEATMAAPGGAKEGGSKVSVSLLEAALNSPGEIAGSKVVADPIEAALLSPGAQVGMGSSVRVLPMAIILSTLYGPIVEIISSPSGQPNPNKLTIGGDGTTLYFGDFLEALSGTITKTGPATRLDMRGDRIALQSGAWTEGAFVPTQTLEVNSTGCYWNNLRLERVGEGN